MPYSNLNLNCHRTKRQKNNLSEVFREGINPWFCQTHPFTTMTSLIHIKTKSNIVSF